MEAPSGGISRAPKPGPDRRPRVAPASAPDAVSADAYETPVRDDEQEPRAIVLLLDESGTGVDAPSTDRMGVSCSFVAVARRMLPRVLPRPGWLPAIAARTTRKALLCRAFAHAPKRTRTSSIVRWAAQLDPDSAPARMIARGAAVGPPLRVDVAPEDVRRGPLTAPPEGAPLTVVSRYFDN